MAARWPHEGAPLPFLQSPVRHLCQDGVFDIVMETCIMIKGLRTVVYPVADMAAAKDWYAKVFETAPYFDQPFYVGFNVGGFELGLIPDGQSGTAGSMPYWGVDDIAAEVERITALGATIHSAIQDVGEGIKTVELADPFGNLLCLVVNPHFDAKAVR
jgi:predicted enzyme related to lactoylglutathione lyase